MRNRIFKFSSTAIFTLAFFLLSAQFSLATDFFYFNPDSTQSNLARLKRAMDKVLSQNVPVVSFQPFARLSDFDRKVKEGRPAFLFLPDWYLEQNGNRQKFAPFLRPLRNGLSTYKKVLLVPKKSTTTIKDMKGKTMAMTSMGPNGLKLLNQTLFSHHGLDSKQLSIITTSKDSDAIFALALQQVDAALVSQDNLALIGNINPRILQTVRPLLELPPISLPILCYTKGNISDSEIAAMKKIFLKDHQEKEFINLMEMLKIDAWQIFTN